jgi:hypothetical protein
MNDRCFGRVGEPPHLAAHVAREIGPPFADMSLERGPLRALPEGPSADDVELTTVMTAQIALGTLVLTAATAILGFAAAVIGSGPP